MFGYRGFKRIYLLIASQTVALAAAAMWTAYILAAALSGGAGSSLSPPVLMSWAALLFLLWAAWAVSTEPVELLWGTSAKVRIHKMLAPALLGASIALGLETVVVSFVSRTPGANAASSAFALLVIAALLTLSGLLFVSARRRSRAYRDVLERMSHTLEAPSGAALHRIQASVGNEAGTIETSVKANPQGFTFAGLSSKPWHDPSDFPWLTAFVDAVHDIGSEAERVLKLGDGRVTKYDYVGLEGDFWKSFKFVARHKPIDENLAECPKTAALLQTIPGYPIFRDAMFSILEPGGVIRPHRDVSNVFLTLHLPLVAPENSYLEVGGLKKSWQRGKPLVFDSSYMHQAVNASDQTRVILLVDFPHPELTETELEWVHRMHL